MQIKSKLNNHPKSKILTVLIACFLLINACKKEKIPNNQQDILNEAKAWYLKQSKNTDIKVKSTNGLSADISLNPLWDQANINQLQDSAVLVKIPVESNFNKELGRGTGKMLLVISKQAGLYKYRYISQADNSVENINEMTSDKLYQETFAKKQANDLTEYNKYLANPILTKDGNRERLMDLVCTTTYAITIVSTDYPGVDPYITVENLGTTCTGSLTTGLMSFGPDFSNGTSVGNGASGANTQLDANQLNNLIPFDDGKPKITDIKKYTKCFTDGKQAQSYTMTIFVDQPVAGQSDWYRTVLYPISGSGYTAGLVTGIGYTTADGSTLIDVGHTFVTFEKNNIDGTNVRQTLGFYPSANTFQSKGAMEDNSGHSADVSYTINVTKEQFEAALQKVESDFDTKDYVLLNINGKEYNCTDAAISYMNAAGANFGNSSIGLFKNTPGTFGQVLRNKSGANLYPGNGIYGKGPCN